MLQETLEDRVIYRLISCARKDYVDVVLQCRHRNLSRTTVEAYPETLESLGAESLPVASWVLLRVFRPLHSAFAPVSSGWRNCSRRKVRIVTGRFESGGDLADNNIGLLAGIECSKLVLNILNGLVVGFRVDGEKI